MICPNCGKSISSASEFCELCGKPTGFSESLNQRPSIQFTKTEPAPGASSADLREALQQIGEALRKLPTREDMKRNLRRHITVSIITALVVAVLCLLFAFSFTEIIRWMYGKPQASAPAPTAIVTQNNPKK